MSDAIHVLHVDDDPDFADLTAVYLERGDDGFVIDTAESAAAGLDRLSDDVDCVVSDYDMPGTNGIEFLSAVREEYPDLPFILFTGKGSEEIASDAISAGVTDYLRKGGGSDKYELLANRITNAVDQVRAERRLQEERRRFQILFDRLSQATVEVEYEGDDPIVQRVNPAFGETFGYDVDDIVGDSLDAYIVPDDRTDEAAAINQRVKDGTSLFSEEVTRLTAEGTRRFLLQNAVYDDGSGGFAIYTDITERKERERELEQKNTRLRALFEHFPEPTIAYTFRDGEPYLADVNSAFTEVFGYEPETAVGEPTDDLVVPEDRDDEAKRLDERVRAGDLIDEEVTRLTAGGTGDFRFRNIHLPDDENIDGYGVYADITAYRDRERELERQNERLDRFVSVVSHDLRSPLTLASSRLELAAEECDSPYLADVADAHERIERLIDGLLTFARTDSDALDRTVVDFPALVEECWETLRSEDATLVVETERSVRADPDRLRQLVINLLSNALDHCGPDVTVRVGDLSDDEGFYVADDGPGVPEDDPTGVLEAGYSTAQRNPGLGLSVVTQVADAHDWEVRVTDSDEGARFEVAGVGLPER
ncbi:hybrid sensor histidine kinase/response regulator [Halobacteriales archaeon SW_5_70_135]|nr:MAG: hybrid sensor histidine kinase/response regulator [Halobacteriales archaeon SW_5_70_135]